MRINKILYLLNFLMALGYNAVSKILPAFLTTITSSALQISFVSSAYNIGKMVSGAAGGMFADWFGKKNTLLASLAFVGFFSLILTIGNTIEWFILVFFFIGIFASLFYFSLNSVTTIINKGRAKALSKLEMVYQLGFIFGPMMGGAVAVMMGMNSLFLIWALLMFIGCVAVLFMNLEEKRTPIKSVAKNYIKVIRADPLNFLLLVVLGVVFLGIAEGARDILIPLYAVDLGFDILMIGAIFMVSAIITMVGIVPFGHLADKIGRKPIIIIALLMMGFSFLLLEFTNSLIMLGILTGLLSLGRTAGLMGARAFASDISGAEIRTTSFALIELCLSFGRIGGAIAAGLLKDVILIGPTLEIFFWAMIALSIIYSVLFAVKRK
ncbi:MAG: MFS transporter [Candidatus Aenigmarchaeota archaeon]